jgi:hypothetical protein
MFKATIKIESVKTEGTISLVTLNLELQNKALGDKTFFTISSTGAAIRVDSSHLIQELNSLVRWLHLPSLEEDNLRDNTAELRAIVREAIKANEKINSIKIL